MNNIKKVLESNVSAQLSYSNTILLIMIAIYLEKHVQT
jgi:hypothetical protein